MARVPSKLVPGGPGFAVVDALHVEEDDNRQFVSSLERTTLATVPETAATISDFAVLAGAGLVVGSYLHKDTGVVTANALYHYQFWTGLTEGQPVKLSARISGAQTALACWYDDGDVFLGSTLAAPSSGHTDYNDHLLVVPPGAVKLGMSQAIADAVGHPLGVKAGVRREGLLDTLDGASSTAMEALSSTFATVQRIGMRSAMSASGASNAVANTYVWEEPAAQAGFVGTVVFMAHAAGTLAIKVASKSGDVFTVVSSTSVAIPSAGTYTLTPADFGRLPVAAGQYVGFWSDCGWSRGSSTVEDYDGYYNGTGGTDVAVGGTFTDSSVSNQRLLAYIDVATPVRDANPMMQAISDVATLNSSMLAHDIAMSAMLADGLIEAVTDTWGHPLPVPDGTTNLNVSNVFIYALPIEADGVVETVYGYYSGAGTTTVATYTSDGGSPPTFTPTGRSVTVSVSGAGAQSADIALPVYEGEHVGRSSTVGRYSAAAGYSGGYFAGSPAGFTAGSSTPVTNTRLHFGVSVKSYAVAPSVVAAEAEHTITLFNSDSIALVGDSTSTPGFVPRRKGWLHKLSQFSDYGFENFSKTGDDYSEMLDRIQANTPQYHASLGYQDYRPKYAMLASEINDASAYDFNTYQEHLRQLVGAVVSFGAVPILVPEFKDTGYGNGNDIARVAMQMLADQYSGYFVDARRNGRLFGTSVTGWPGYYAGFWAGVHPGVRNNEIYSNPIEMGLRKLPRVDQSIKIFRPLGSVAGVNDLAFDDHFGRASVWQEIQIGERVLTDATRKYYDELDDNLWVNEYLTSEYLTLIDGGTIAIDDYALIDVILPAKSSAVSGVRLLTGDATLTAWVLKADTTTPPGAGDPMCKPVSVTVDGDGTIALAEADLQGAIRGDRISIILYKSGGFALSAPILKWSGTPGKDATALPGYIAPATGVELLAETNCGEAGELAAWTITGTISGTTPVGELPVGVTKVAVVNGADMLTQVASFAAADNDRWAVLAVWSRNFPPLFDSASDVYPDDSAITEDSFDWRRLQVDLGFDTGNMIHVSDHVGLWWRESLFRVLVPAGWDQAAVRISASDDLEIARVSLRWEA